MTIVVPRFAGIRPERRRTRLVLLLLAGPVCCAIGYSISWSISAGPPAADCAGAGCVPLHPATARLPDPCTALTVGEIADAFSAKVGYVAPHPEYHGCTWSGLPFANRYGHQVVSIDLAWVTRAEFERAYSTWIVPGAVAGSRRRARTTPVYGVGQAAFTENNQSELEVWYRGMVLYITTELVTSPLQTEKRLARDAIASLEKRRSETSAA